MKRKKFLPEIQGLRALAVISVVLFHLKIPLLSGGFVGVDVFFVISGFVVTLIIKNELLNSQFSIRSFLVRRLWRIMPALLATVFFTAIIFLPFFPSTIDKSFLHSSIASTFGVANIYYYFTVNYFSSGIDNPLLHIWSLGVEEQFYLLFPLVLAVSNYYKKNIPVVLSIITIVSFTASSIEVFVNQSAAFYLPWHRAWEFSVGALIAWTGFQCRTKLVSWLGFISLVSVIVFYQKSFIFPGFGALLPVVGTMLLLVSINADTIVNKMLRTRFMTYIGNMSYSMYLVHWPLICLVGFFLPINNLYVGGILIVSSLMGAALLYHFIELPLLGYYRKNKTHKSKARFTFTMPAISLILVFAMLGWSLVVDAFWSRNPQAFAYMTTKAAPELFRLNECFFVGKKDGIQEYYEECMRSKNDIPNILIAGDSLSANITSSLITAMPDYHFLQASGVNYKPGRPEKWSETAKVLNSHLEADIWENEDIPDVVVYFAMWENEDLQYLLKEVKKVKALGSKVIVIGPPVDYLTNVPILQGISEVIGYDLVTKVSRKNRKEMDTIFRERLNGISDGYLSLYQIFCSYNECMHMENNKSYYVDKVHFSAHGVSAFIPELTGMIKQINDK